METYLPTQDRITQAGLIKPWGFQPDSHIYVWCRQHNRQERIQVRKQNLDHFNTLGRNGVWGRDSQQQDQSGIGVEIGLENVNDKDQIVSSIIAIDDFGESIKERFLLALDSGKLVAWKLQLNDETPTKDYVCQTTIEGGILGVTLVENTNNYTNFVVGTAERGLQMVRLNWLNRQFLVESIDTQSMAPTPEKNGGRNLFQSVFEGLARFQNPPVGASMDALGKKPRVGLLSSMPFESGQAAFVTFDDDAVLWFWAGSNDTIHPIKQISMKEIFVEAIINEMQYSRKEQHLDRNLEVKALDATFCPGKSCVAVLVSAVTNLQEKMVALFVFDISAYAPQNIRQVYHFLITDTWLVGAAETNTLRLIMANDMKSFLIRSSDGHVIAFTGNMEDNAEVVGVHLHKFAWDACEVVLHGRWQFLLMKDGLDCHSLSETFLDMCQNIVDALPKGGLTSDIDNKGVLSAIDIQLNDKMEQHSQLLMHLHSRGWLDIIDAYSAGQIVRAGEYIAALQCIRSKENLLQEQHAQEKLSTAATRVSSSVDDQSVSLGILREIIDETGKQIGKHKGSMAFGESQSWETFYSKPLESRMFLDIISKKAESLMEIPKYDLSREMVAQSSDIKFQSTALNTLCRLVLELLNVVESWIHAVDDSGIPALPGSFGHQEGYSWISCPNACSALLNLCRLCIHYHGQWKSRAPSLASRLSLQLHSLVTQYLSSCKAMLEATPVQAKTAEQQLFQSYVDAGEEILGALLESAHQESNHMLIDAVAELAEVYRCYAVLFDLCKKWNDLDRLYYYMRVVQPEVSPVSGKLNAGFAGYAFERLIEAKRLHDLLELPSEFDDALLTHLQDKVDPLHQELLWLHMARMRSFQSCSSTLYNLSFLSKELHEKQKGLGLSKLCLLAEPYGDVGRLKEMQEKEKEIQVQIQVCRLQASELKDIKRALSVADLGMKLMEAGKPGQIIQLLALAGPKFQSENLDVFKAAWQSSLLLDQWDAIYERRKLSDNEYRSALRATSLYDSIYTCTSSPCILSQAEILDTLKNCNKLSGVGLQSAADAIQLGVEDGANLTH